MDTASLVDTHVSHIHMYTYIHTYLQRECERQLSLAVYIGIYRNGGWEHAGQTFSLCKCRHICIMYAIYIDVGISSHTLFSWPFCMHTNTCTLFSLTIYIHICIETQTQSERVHMHALLLSIHPCAYILEEKSKIYCLTHTFSIILLLLYIIV